MDHDIVTRVQRGDEQAFESLVKADFSRLYRVARGVIGDPHLAEDATQQAFVEIWRDIPRLRDSAKVEGWPIGCSFGSATGYILDARLYPPAPENASAQWRSEGSYSVSRPIVRDDSGVRYGWHAKPR